MLVERSVPRIRAVVRVTAVAPPLIPGTDAPGSLAPLATALDPLPLPAVRVRPRQAGLVYALSRLDASGRLSAVTVLAALRWPTAVRLAAGVVGASVVFRPDRNGLFALDPKRKVVLPRTLRRPCRLQTGDQALLVADTRENILAIHPMTTLDRLVLAHHTALLVGDPA